MPLRVADLILFGALKDLSSEELETGMQEITVANLFNSQKQELRFFQLENSPNDMGIFHECLRLNK